MTDGYPYPPLSAESTAETERLLNECIRTDHPSVAGLHGALVAGWRQDVSDTVRTPLASSRRALTSAVGVAIARQEGDRVWCVEVSVPGLPPFLLTQDDGDRLASAIYDASTDAREANDPGARRG